MEAFHFLRPWWLLALVPLAALAWRLRLGDGGTAAWTRVVDAHLLPFLLAPPRALRLPAALLALGWVVGVLALAGPTWSRVPAVRFVAPQPPLVVVLDLSASMEAADVPPSRLLLARARLLDLLDRLPPRPVGVAVFAGSGHLALPPSDDPHVVAKLLPQLRTDLPAVPGSRAAAGLEQALDILRRAEAEAGDVLLVADEAGPGAATIAARLNRVGARVSVLAVGSPEGVLTLGKEPVLVPVDTAGLREVAMAGGGAFLDWRDDPVAMVEAVSARHGGDVAADLARANRIVWRDQGPWLALVLVPLAALAFRRGWLGAMALLWLAQAQPAQALEWSALWQRPDQRAQSLLDQGEAFAAAELFPDPFRRGVALYRGGDYALAAESFAKTDTAEAAYNQGNALAQLGMLKQARAAYERALAHRPNHGDARFNLSLVEQAIGFADDGRRTNQPAPFRDERPPRETPQGEKAEPQKDLLTAPGLAEQQPSEERSPAGAAPDAPQAGRATDKDDGGEKKGGGSGNDGQGRDGSKSTATQSAPSAQAALQRDGDASERTGATTPKDKPPESGADAPSAAAATEEARRDPGAPGESPQQQGGTEGDGDTGIGGAKDDGDGDDQRQALEQWLERVPDQSASLLKELFRRQHERQRYPVAETKPW